ncbi:MAG: hypothetical protein WAX69_11620 [Victivallales bacterium]
MKTSNEKQIMGLSYTPRWLLNPELAIPALREVKNGGFGLVIGFIRHMKQTVASETVRNAVAQTTDHCHSLGLRFAVDMDWAHWVDEFVERRPEMAMWSIRRGEAVCMDGAFVVDIPYTGQGIEEFAEISAAYGVDAKGNTTLLTPEEYACRRDSFNSQYPFPSFDDDRAYDYYRPGMGGHYTLKLSGATTRRFTRVVFYVAFMGYKYADVAHPAYLEVQRNLLLSYKDIPLDGVNWDEPGKGGSTRGYKAGAGFLSFFEKRHGYDLRSRLISLDEGSSPGTLATRRDYYDTLNEMNHQAQAEFNSLAIELFGKNIHRGSHHTFAGLAVDIRCGCSDYFRQGKVLSHAFTDTGWEQGPFSETIYNFALAEGLRKELGMPGAYCNDWSRTPRVKWYDYFTRVKMLYRIDWFAIFVGLWCERHSTFPDDKYWVDVTRNAQALNSVNKFLDDEYEAVSETAVWHGWEGVSALPASMNFNIRLLQTFSFNLSQIALESGQFFDYVSSKAIEAATPSDGTVKINGRTYRRLIVPYAVAVSGAMWKSLRRCIENKVRIVFVGPPPRWNLDTGEDLSPEFCAMAGVAPFTLEEYTAYFLSRKPKPSFDAWEPPLVDFSYPLSHLEGTVMKRDMEGSVASVENSSDNVVYIPGPDPRSLLSGYLGGFHSAGIALEHSGGAHKRMLSSRDGKKHVLLLAARMEQELDEQINIHGKAIIVKGGGWAAIKIAGTDIADTLIDPKGKIETPAAD